MSLQQHLADLAGRVAREFNEFRARETTLNAATFGTTANGSAAIQAAHDALPAKGGRIYVPAGDWQCPTPITITKPCRIEGAGGTLELGATRLVFAPGVAGIDVHLSDSGLQFEMDSIALVSQSTAAGAGQHGLRVTKGRPVLHNCSAAYFGGHGFFFDSTGTGKNCNHGTLDGVRAYSNRGDGMRFEGIDSNAYTVIGADVVGNYGWGINSMASHNVFIHPHADQQYNGSPGAFRDNGMSNKWDWVYSEGVAPFLIDSGSSWGYLSVSTFGEPAINRNGAGHQSWEIVRRGAHERAAVTNGTKRWVAGVGVIGANTYDIFNDTDGKTALSINPSTVEATWWGSQMPLNDNAQDLGWVGGRWRDIHAARYFRLGSLVLRQNGTTLQVSSDNGNTWKTVTAT